MHGAYRSNTAGPRAPLRRGVGGGPEAREAAINTPSIGRVAQTRLPTRHGDFRMVVYATPDGKEQVALTVGAIGGEPPVLVRLHSECLTGDVFGSCRCDCGEQLDESMRLLQARGRGVLLYLRQEGRGIGLTKKIQAYALQDRGYDTVEANLALGLPEDARDYGDAAAILRDLGVARVMLLTNNPAKIAGLERHGIAVVGRVPLQMPPNPVNRRYLETKRAKMGHLLP
ncbi:MAG TPA: GTP cyclohydrolase II [Thermomicrobiales bacterium]|nr:GTP cyclohydrolase II [Thermomicrobiales bacterium]